MSHKGEITLKRLGVHHKWVSSTRKSVMYTCNLDKLPDCWKLEEQVKDCIRFAVRHSTSDIRRGRKEELDPSQKNNHE